MAPPPRPPGGLHPADRPPPRVQIESIRPQLDCGRLPAKALVNEAIPVAATVFVDGHDLVSALVRVRDGEGPWHETPMVQGDHDRWTATIRCPRPGAAEFQVVGWIDRIGTWLRDAGRRREAGLPIALELEEGARLLSARSPELPASQRAAVLAASAGLGASGRPEAERLAAVAGSAVVELLRRLPDPETVASSAPLSLWVERERAGVGAWYELFPRSEGATESARGPRSGTLAAAQRRLPALAEMGFDVVYLPPVHPIGRTGRKGPNNTRPAGPHDPGSPWAVGGAEGGHTAVHPDLGTLRDFQAFVARAEQLGLEVALDLALQCSPDHPWVTEHPEWFRWRPDGTVHHAENPPKVYEDIVPLDFTCADWRGLWAAVRDVVYCWVDRGVRIFRVDNPHTKPVALWAWLIAELRRDHPDVVLLAEAFTRPALLERLAMVGFSQSYTYFTWRQQRDELAAFAQDLSETTADHLRPTLFVNTPDILTAQLQQGGPPAFRSRLVLAATLSPSYGIYSGFELAENQALRPGSEEYLDSEKYQLRPRDWDQPHSLAPLITRVNAIRRRHPALRRLRGLRLHGVDTPQLLCYSRSSDDGRDHVLMVVNLDPARPQEGTTHLDLVALGLPWDATFTVRDELTGADYRWHGPHNYVRLDPEQQPAHIFSVEA